MDESMALHHESHQIATPDVATIQHLCSYCHYFQLKPRSQIQFKNTLGKCLDFVNEQKKKKIFAVLFIIKILKEISQNLYIIQFKKKRKSPTDSS